MPLHQGQNGGPPPVVHTPVLAASGPLTVASTKPRLAQKHFTRVDWQVKTQHDMT